MKTLITIMTLAFLVVNVADASSQTDTGTARMSLSVWGQEVAAQQEAVSYLSGGQNSAAMSANLISVLDKYRESLTYPQLIQIMQQQELGIAPEGQE